MQEWVNEAAGQLDAAGAFLRVQMVNYPVLTGALGGMLLLFVVLNLVVMPLRIAWWRFICWRNRLAGKLMSWNYDGDVADAIVAVTNRYYASGRLSHKQKKEKFRILAMALSLPELHPEPKYHRPLHPKALEKLRKKTINGLHAFNKEPVHTEIGKKVSKVKLTVVNGTKAA